MLKVFELVKEIILYSILLYNLMTAIVLKIDKLFETVWNF